MTRGMTGILLGATLGAACATDGPPGDARAQIDAATAAMFAAYEASDLDSAVSFFTPDAVLMPPDAPTVRGGEMPEHMGAGMALGRWIQTAPTDTLIDLGDHAVQIGRYTIRFEPTDATPEGMTAFTDSGRYVVHWEHDGSRWRMAHYIANRDGS